jgi:hypothetical protein
MKAFSDFIVLELYGLIISINFHFDDDILPLPLSLPVKEGKK